LVEKLVQRFKEMYGERVCDINGARVEFENGWGLVRASSNMPMLGLLFEAKTEQDLREIKKIFKGVLRSYKELCKPWINDDDE
jgi:phosphomannomutase/phosphoglucomutase